MKSSDDMRVSMSNFCFDGLSRPLVLSVVNLQTVSQVHAHPTDVHADDFHGL